MRDIAAQASLARARINHVVIGRCHSQTADGRGTFFVEDGRVSDGAVRGLPKAATFRAEIICTRIARYTGHGKRTPAAEWANQAIAHAPKKRVALLVGLVLFLRSIRRRGFPRLRDGFRHLSRRAGSEYEKEGLESHGSLLWWHTQVVLSRLSRDDRMSGKLSTCSES